MLRRLSFILALFLALAPLARAGGLTNPGVYNLAVAQITVAQTAAAQTPIASLDGATAASIEAAFGYGSGGTSCDVVVQTSLDGGTTWRDIAHFTFTTASAVKYANLSGLTAKGITAYADLAAEGVNDGLVGNQLRAVITSVGTYANTTLSVRVSVR